MSTVTRSLLLLLLAGGLSACDKSAANTQAKAEAKISSTTPTATEPKAAAPTGKTFGAGVKLTDSTSIDAILADPMAFHGKTVRVEGMITDVCPKRGCWFEMAGNGPGQKLRFKVTDGEMVFPPDAKGQIAVAEGVVTAKQLTLDETKAFAEYQAKEYGKEYDPASITTPTVNVRIDGTGAVFRDKI